MSTYSYIPVSTRFGIYLDYLQFLGTMLKGVQSFYDSWNVSRRRCFAWINRATLSNRPVGTSGRDDCLPAPYFERSVDPISIWRADYAHLIRHTGRNCFSVFQISFSDWLLANTADAHPGVSRVSKDQKFIEEFKNTHYQVYHPPIIE